MRKYILNYYKSNNFKIYKHTTPSGKCYIGYTQQAKLSYRARKNGIGYQYNPAFWNAICKYGWDNIKHEILEDHLTFDEANERERYYIQLYKSNDKRYGYNLTEGSSNPNCTLEIREKIRKAKLGTRRYTSKIYQYDASGQQIGFFRSYRETEEKTGVNLYAVASGCNKKGVVHGYVFSHIQLTPDEVFERYRKQKNTKYIYTYDILFDKILPKIDGILTASKIFRISEDSICISASNNPNKDFTKEFSHGYCFQTTPFTAEKIQQVKTKFWAKSHRSGDINRWKKERNGYEKHSD